MKSKLKLTDRVWKDFLLTEFFCPIKGNQNNMSSLLSGRHPLISAKKENNGLKGFILPNDKASFQPHCITLNLDGDGGAGLAFYHEYSFALDSHVVALYPKRDLSRWILLFIVRSLSSQQSRFGHGRAIKMSRLYHFPLMLPANSNGAPDWAFMEAYMKEVEEELLAKSLPKLESQLLDNIIMLGALEDREWKEFVFGDLFTITSTSSSIDKKRLSGNKGDNPYITRSENDNGIDSFVEEQSGYVMDEGNVITIGLDTQTVFYQSCPFYTGQNIQIVRHTKLNKHNALFIIRAIKVLVQKFSWGSYGATLMRLRRGKLYLPIGMDGTPDWEFMSAFMKRVEQETLLPALQHFKSKKCNQMLMGGVK